MAIRIGTGMTFKPAGWKPEKILPVLANSLKDPTSISLVISNLLILVFAVAENTSLMTILWIYWCQSVIIGIFNFFKILTLKDFSTEGVKTAPEFMATSGTLKIFLAGFFAVHYGFFHLIYAFFLGTFSMGGFFSTTANSIDFGFILTAAALFFLNHLFSFLYYRNKQTTRENIGKVFIFPYARIIPMHLTIIFGGMLLSLGLLQHFVLVFFLLLKTIADLAMHAIEHAEQQQSPGNI